MADLDKLHTDYRAARLKYLNIRRDAEEALMAEIVACIKDIADMPAVKEHVGKVMADRAAAAKAAADAHKQAEIKRVEAEKEDRMAKAREVKAAKRAALLAAAAEVMP